MNNSDEYINGMPSANGLISAVYNNIVHFYDDVFDRKLCWFPEPRKPVPDYVLQKLRAAEKLYLQIKHDDDFIEATGTAYRKTLGIAFAILDNGIDKNLNQRISQLVKNGVLVKSMGDFAHSIRIRGNDATHTDFSQDELEELYLFTQLFLQYTFTLPKKTSDKVKKS